MKILIVTFSEDFYTIDLVASFLEQNGHEVHRFNTDTFPQKTQFIQKIDKNGHQWSWTDGVNHWELETFDSVWIRKTMSPQIDTSLDITYQDGVLRESKVVLSAFLNHCAKKKNIIDPLLKVKKAVSKSWQLEQALEVGLQIPETLITNNSKALETFYHQQNKSIITKLQIELEQSMQGGKGLYTQKITDEHIKNIDLLVYAPMIFQREIEKVYELRIIYIDGIFYTGKINATQSKTGQTDWRVSEVGSTYWEHYELPNTLKEKLRTFMLIMELRYGAIDIIRDIEGNYIFLEVNPRGEWGMLQKELGLPIAEAIGKGLL